MFFKKPITLHCYTADKSVYNYSPPQKGVKFIPNWWKSLPPSGKNWKEDHRKGLGLNGSATMRNCEGFKDLYKKSIVLPLWSDLRLYFQESPQTGFEYSFADKQSEVSWHDPKQYNNHYKYKDYQHLKIISPWHIHCDADIDFVMMPPVWESMNEFEPLTFLSGVVNFHHHTSTNIPLFVKRSDKETYIDLPFNFPLAFMIPMTERKVVVKTHFVTVEDLRELWADKGVEYNRFFGSNYSKYKKLRGKHV